MTRWINRLLHLLIALTLLTLALPASFALADASQTIYNTFTFDFGCDPIGVILLEPVDYGGTTPPGGVSVTAGLSSNTDPSFQYMGVRQISEPTNEILLAAYVQFDPTSAGTKTGVLDATITFTGPGGTTVDVDTVNLVGNNLNANGVWPAPLPVVERSRISIYPLRAYHSSSPRA